MMRKTPNPRFRAGAAAVPALLLALVVTTGCSGGSTKTSATSTPSSTKPPSEVTNVTVEPGVSKGFVVATGDVTFSCARVAGAWKASGKVTNTSKATANYRIYTTFLDKDKYVRGMLQTDVNGVPAGAKRDWSGQLALNLKDLRCVPRVERTAVK